MTVQPIALVLVAALAGPFASHAQAQDRQAGNTQADASAPSSRLPVKMGQTVWVTVIDGWEVKGVVSDIAATTIDVSGEAGTKHLNVSEIRRVAKRDSVKNGFLIGAAVAVLPALAVGALSEEEFGGNPSSSERAGAVAGAFGIGVAVYGGIGALIDHFIEGRRTIYEKPRAQATLQVTPIVTRGGVGLGGSIRW
jgi:hypothetical protein